MILKKILFLFLIAFLAFFKGQNLNIDSYTLIDKAVKKLYQNPDDCITFTQGVSMNTKSYEHRIILQNIMAQAYAMKGDFVQSIKTSLEGETLKGNNELTSFSQLFMDYSLAEQYQNLGLYNQSGKIINEIINSKIHQKSNNPSIKITLAKVYQLQAINLAIIRKTEESEKAFAKSNSLLNNSNNENQIIRGENELLLAMILMNQNKNKEAKRKIEKVLADNEDKEFNFLNALAYENFSRYYFLQKDNKKALEYLEKSFSTIENSNYHPLNTRIYESMSKNHSALQQPEKYQHYNTLFLNSKGKLDSNKKDGIRYLIKLVETQENKNIAYFSQSEKEKNQHIVIGCIIALSALGLYYFYETRSSKELKKQLDFFENLKQIEIVKQGNSTDLSIPTDITVNDEPQKPEKKPVIISKEKENEILEKLKEMEQSERFLNKNMSLATLAGQLDTNTKYLSEVIKNYKGKNFNSYINELRINHIAYLLKNNPVFLNYKVSYLADFSGFSSHSAFTTVFKSVTGMSPNSYIQQINQTKSS